MAFVKIYSNVVKGYLIGTGNSLGLGDGGSAIGVFTTLDTTKQVAGYPNGTTSNYLENSSSAYLNLPPGSTVEYAVLTWGGTIGTDTIVSGTCEFTTPASTIPNTLVANPAYYSLSNGYGSNSAVVTSLVSAGGTGFYTVSKAYSTLGGAGSALGWMLNVVVTNTFYTRKMIDINVGILFLISASTNTVITGLLTPKSGAVTGRYLTMGYEGEGGNSASINAGLGVLPLTGPNNTQAGFLNKQINNCDSLSPNVGQIDTTGTFGTFNSTGTGAVTKGMRYGTDVTNVSLNGKIANNISTVTLINTSAGDGVAYAVNAFQIDNEKFMDPTKSVDKNFSSVGESLTYTIAITNTGTLPYTNVVLTDTIPTGTSFVANSLKIDGITNPGNPSPPTGINLGTIPVATTTTITFNVLVSSTIPSPNPVRNNASVTFNYIGLGQGINSNTVNTTVSSAILSSTKIGRNYAKINDVVTYTITIRNTGNSTANNILFVDTIPLGTSFIPNSLKQDATSIASSPNPPGVTLPNVIGSGRTSTITFNVTVITIPTQNPIPNSASQTYNYLIDPSTVPNIIGNSSSNSNIVYTTVSNARLSNISKSVDKIYATCSDILTYTITIPNNGNVTAANVIFRDTIPSGTNLVPNSVTLNGITQPGANPQSGINIGTISAGAYSVVTFSVQISC